MFDCSELNGILKSLILSLPKNPNAHSDAVDGQSENLEKIEKQVLKKENEISNIISILSQKF